MQTIELERATIRVAKVFDLKPGRKRGTLKDDAGTLWSPLARDMATYVEGREYDVEFEINDNGGVSYRNIERGRVLQSRPAPDNMRGNFTEITAPKVTPKAKVAANGFYKPTSPTDARRMFICSQMNALVTSRQVELSVDGIAAAIKMFAGAYDQTIGAEDVQD